MQRRLIAARLVLVPERFAVGGEALVEPDVVPGGASDVIPPPLVRQLMENSAFPGEVAENAGNGLVFHATAPAELEHAVFFVDERIESKQVTVGRQTLVDNHPAGAVRGGVVLRIGKEHEWHLI